MTKAEVLSRIEAIGIIPAIRVPTADAALFAARAVIGGDIPVIELPMTIPGAIDVMATLVKETPGLIVGAGTLWDQVTARRCIDAGALFLTSPGLDPGMVEFAAKHGIAVLPGVLTPTEVMTAWRSGADMVKVFPCSQVGGPNYIRMLRAPFPDIPMIASGGVSQQTATDFILAGAAALGIGSDLIPNEAIRMRHPEWIHELARRFTNIVKSARERFVAHGGSIPHAAH
jgi:2-dehydro-3-deoxyphosphogluconate aldolase/(4S)-4-hydroxy-2-oxoglutarate aldolase